MHIAGYLPDKYDKKIEETCNKLKITKSQLVRLAVINIVERITK